MSYLHDLKKKLSAGIITVPEVVQEAYFPALDGLRGFAVLMVIGYHFGLNHFLKRYNILINGDFGVDIFFVISGFLITTLLLKEKAKYGQISLKRFYIRRALRIIPAAYLFLIVMILLAVIYNFRIPVSAFLASFLFYKNIPHYNDSFTGHFWSLAAEVQFYLIFPLLLRLNVNRYLLIVFSIVILVPLIAILGYYHAGFLFSNHFTTLVTKIIMYAFWKGPFIILVGSLLAVLLFKGAIKIDGGRANYFLSFVLLIVAVVISSTTFVFYSKYTSEYLATLLVAWALLLNLGKRNLLSAILGNRVLVKIGLISYSLYIWQQLFMGNRFNLVWVSYLYDHSPVSLLAIKLVALFTVASASYYLVELKFLKIKSKYEPNAKSL